MPCHCDVLSNPDYVNMLKQDSLAGGAARSVFYRKKREQTQHGDMKLQNEVTRNLISTLKGCLNQGMSLQQILKAAETWVSKPSKKQQKPKVKNRRRRTKLSSTSDQDIGYWKDSSGRWRPYKLDKNGWWYWCDNQVPDQYQSPDWKGYPKAVPQEMVVRDDTWISSLRPLDWSTDIAPNLVSFGKIRNALRSGEKPPGNVVEVWSKAQVEELQSLWTTYENPAALTALLCGEAMQMPNARLTRLTLQRGTWGPKLENVALLQTIANAVAGSCGIVRRRRDLEGSDGKKIPRTGSGKPRAEAKTR